jgi:hypothetical protein
MIFENMSEKFAASPFYSEGGGSRVLQNNDTYLPHYMVSHSRKVIFTVPVRTAKLIW